LYAAAGLNSPYGLALIHLYGNSRVHLFSKQYVYKGNFLIAYHSTPVESEIGKIQDGIDLVLTSQMPKRFLR